MNLTTITELNNITIVFRKDYGNARVIFENPYNPAFMEMNHTDAIDLLHSVAKTRAIVVTDSTGETITFTAYRGKS